ncbi:hypothetical protein KRX11_10025 [Pasteurellaceae bacterium TAE3-ERU1]|nr:hypothetical protein [Pasteurellaceae bacterium TAE3-ERU1]
MAGYGIQVKTSRGMENGIAVNGVVSGIFRFRKTFPFPKGNETISLDLGFKLGHTPREILIVDEPLAYPGNDFAGTQLFYFAIVGDKLKLAPYRGHNTGQELPNSTYAWVDPINKRMVLSKIIIVVA